MNTPSNISQLLLNDKDTDFLLSNQDYTPQLQHQPVHGTSSSSNTTINQFEDKLSQVCGLLLQLTKEQRETNTLLRKLINEESPGAFQLVKLSNHEKYVRFLVVLENERSRPRITCPICKEDVEITTAKGGGCKQQSFCGDYVVCNECTNDSLQKIMRCSVCCEKYSNIPVPICSHLVSVISSKGHLARKGSGNGCPLCSGKLVKEKCPQRCSRKQLPNYNMAKTILSERVFVLVKNPEACNGKGDRPCSHYCRCAKHNILFTNRNKGAKCRECTKELNTKKLGKRKRDIKPIVNSSSNLIESQPQSEPNMKKFCTQDNSPANSNQTPSFLQDLNTLSPQVISNQNQHHSQHHSQHHNPHYPPHLQYSNDSFSDGFPQNQNYWLPMSLNDVRELGKKVSLDDLFKLSEKIPYGEGVVELGKKIPYAGDVVEFGKRVTNGLSNSLGFRGPNGEVTQPKVENVDNSYYNQNQNQNHIHNFNGNQSEDNNNNQNQTLNQHNYY